jgi:hypothetical protein
LVQLVAVEAGGCVVGGEQSVLIGADLVGLAVPLAVDVVDSRAELPGACLGDCSWPVQRVVGWIGHRW